MWLFKNDPSVVKNDTCAQSILRAHTTGASKNWLWRAGEDLDESRTVSNTLRTELPCLFQIDGVSEVIDLGPRGTRFGDLASNVTIL